MDAVISIHPIFSQEIKTGRKTVEVRRRGINLEPETKLWIYETLPNGKIESCAVIDHIFKGTPKDIWESYSEQIGIRFDEFQEYFSGCDHGSAIVMKDVRIFNEGLSLEAIKLAGYKSIPQTYRRLVKGDALLKKLNDLSDSK
ncbi:MAG: hypothetical protein AXW15_04375 [Neptuniibacter sp. Phe_28]|nr:MAG: hypothetical protein AXW15_04375 [Neptuniibacter sp. Phe_28]